MMGDAEYPLRLFFSYAQEDARWQKRLEKHLSGLRRQNFISTWDNRKITPGSDWKQEHAAQLDAASIILLLISLDYINSEECYHEMQQALSRHKKGIACVIPILLRPVPIEDAPFHRLQCLPTNRVPITHWRRSDDALHDVVKGIRDVVTRLITSEHAEIFYEKEENELKGSVVDGALYNPQKGSVTGQQEVTESRVEKSPDPEESSPQYNAARQRYLERTYKRYNSVRLPIGPSEGFSLQAIFQPLTLRRDPSIAEDLKQKMVGLVLGESSEFISLARSEKKQVESKKPAAIVAENGDDALQKTPQRRMIILGGPGTGKTITLKYLVSKCAREAMAESTTPVPIFLSLTDFARSAKTLQDYLSDVAEDMGVERQYADILWREMEGGRAFICLDSLDEVAPQRRVEMIELVNLLASQAGNTWIIGSRFTEYKGGQFKQGQFAEWELLPMSHSMRLQLSERLFPELRRLLPNAKVVLSSEAFVHLLEHHSHAAAWGENPLLFSLAAIIVLQTGGLPSSRAALYHDVVEAILQTHEQDPSWCNLLMHMLAKLALWLHQSKMRTFTRTDLLTFFSEVQGKSFTDTTELARRTLSSGTIEVVARDTYGFRHQTFQEYLAAAELACLLTDRKSQVCEGGWRLAWSKRTYSRWAEVLRLMVGVLVQTQGKKGREAAQRWLRALLEQRVTREGDPGNLGLMLTLKSLAEVSEITGWETSHTATLEKDIITTWIDELHFADAHHRNVQKASLVRLSDDVSHLRKSLLEQTLNQVLIKNTNKNDSAIASAIFQFMGEQTPLEPLLEALHHNIPEMRTAAVKVLAKQGEHVPIEVLISALKDEHGEVREAAVKALEVQGERVPIEMLVSALKNWRGIAWQEAIKVLGVHAKDMPIEVLLEMLKPNLKDWQDIAWQIAETSTDKHERDKDTVISRGSREISILMDVFSKLRNRQAVARQAVVEALGAQGERVPIEVLISALKDKSQEVRKAAVNALGVQGERVPIEVLISALTDESQEVRKAAVNALGVQGERVPIGVLIGVLISALKNESQVVREAVVKVLEAQKERVPLEVLLATLQDKHSSVREATINALGAQGERVPIEVLISALTDESQEVRKAAVNALGVQRERVPIGVLISALTDESQEAREAVVKVLEAQKERVPLEVLLATLQDKHSSVREAAVNALGAQGERVPIEVLLATLKDENGFVREATVKALGVQGERVPIEVLLATLQDKHSSVREATVKALGVQGERVPIEVLLATLKDENGFVREATVKALGAQGERVPIEVLLTILQSEDKFMRRAAAQSLIGQGERVPPDILMKTLEDEDRDVRRLMLLVIRKIDPEALSALPPEALSILQRQPIGMILSSMIQGFATSTPDDLGYSLQFLLKTLKQLLDWPDTLVRVKAVHILGKIRRYIPDPTIQRLLELRQDSDPTLISAVEEALAEILSLETGIEDD